MATIKEETDCDSYPTLHMEVDHIKTEELIKSEDIVKSEEIAKSEEIVKTEEILKTEELPSTSGFNRGIKQEPCDNGDESDFERYIGNTQNLPHKTASDLSIMEEMDDSLSPDSEPTDDLDVGSESSETPDTSKQHSKVGVLSSDTACDPDSADNNKKIVLPKQLIIKPSQAKKGTLGVWTVSPLPKGTVYGPYDFNSTSDTR